MKTGLILITLIFIAALIGAWFFARAVNGWARRKGEG